MDDDLTERFERIAEQRKQLEDKLAKTLNDALDKACAETGTSREEMMEFIREFFSRGFA